MVALSPTDVTACLVTRGDVDLAPILETLPYGEVIVWNNAERDDWKCAGRYKALLEATNDVVYFQDDDVIFRDHDALLDEWAPGMLAAVYAHGETPDGYDDVALVGAGALVSKSLPWRALNRYLDHWPADDGFKYEADYIVGALTPHRQIKLPFEIRDVAYNGHRLADEPWQRSLKRGVTNRARSLR